MIFGVKKENDRGVQGLTRICLTLILVAGFKAFCFPSVVSSFEAGAFCFLLGAMSPSSRRCHIFIESTRSNAYCENGTLKE